MELDHALEGLAEAVVLTGLPARGSCRMLVELGDTTFGVEVEGDSLRVTRDVDINTTWDFAYTVDASVWHDFCSVPPPRGHTSAQALVATIGGTTVRGDRKSWARYASVLDRVVEALRQRVHGGPPERHPEPRPTTGLSPIVGRYVQVPVAGRSQRLYFEEAGEGQPVVCLHTAGADSRQFRYLLEDEELTKRCRFLAFDMPWHGRSDPPDDWSTERYALETQTYAETVLSFMTELGLDQPILVGCSMGGAIACYLASTQGDRFRGVCALEGGLGNPGRFVSWTNTLEVDQSVFLTSWVGGLIAPSSPQGPRNQTLWGYAQSGPGVYQGDTHFYSNDLPRFADSLEPATCPLYVFNGEYDYSATTEMSRAAADKLGGVLVEMKLAGHFPMSEDPVAFRRHLVPVLDEIMKAS